MLLPTRKNDEEEEEDAVESKKYKINSKFFKSNTYDTIPVENMMQWNQLIMDYKIQHFSNEERDTNFLNNDELQLCKSNNIDVSLYISLKDLFIREITANGPISYEDALQLSDMPENIVKPIYNALNEYGWNTPI